MQNQTASRKDLNPGPFLKLILMSSLPSKQRDETVGNVREAASADPGISVTLISRGDEPVTPAPIPMLGLFLSLVLSFLKDRSLGDSERAALSASSSHSRCSGPQNRLCWFRSEVHTT